MSAAPISARPHAFYIRPAPGWLDLCFDEVTALVGTPLQKYKFEPKVTLLKGTVKLHRCDWRQGLEIMLRLTTAHDVEWLVLESKCTKWSEVDAILERVPWAEILPNRETPVHVTTGVSHGFSESSGKLRENLCRIARVHHLSEGAEIRFKIELRGDFLRLSASLCGEPLYKRGYKRLLEATAPLPEHQAAACLRYILNFPVSGAPVSCVYVPFAGSGTLGFESLLYFSGSGPGSFSRQFACDLFPVTPGPTMKFFRRKLADRLQVAPLPPVIFNDFNAEAISVLRKNVTAFAPAGRFEILEGDAFDVEPAFPAQGRILILLNPPYGDRLAKKSAVPAFYSRLGAHMRKLSINKPDRIVAGCICPDEATWRSFLRELDGVITQTHHFTHGGKEMRLVRWEA